jgi:hypothetical protein
MATQNRGLGLDATNKRLHILAIFFETHPLFPRQLFPFYISLHVDKWKKLTSPLCMKAVPIFTLRRHDGLVIPMN